MNGKITNARPLICTAVQIKKERWIGLLSANHNEAIILNSFFCRFMDLALDSVHKPVKKKKKKELNQYISNTDRTS